MVFKIIVLWNLVIGGGAELSEIKMIGTQSIQNPNITIKKL